MAVAEPASASSKVITQDSMTRERVRWTAGFDPRSPVRVAAWSALITTDVNAGIARYLATEYPYAVMLAEQSKARNADFARRIRDTHPAEYSPEVHAAADAAVQGSTATREAFARTGYAAAKQRDRQARAATGAQEAALVQADRHFVARLRDQDPGPQVRAAATFALRTGSTDTDLVEFFAHDWIDAAGLDLRTFRIRCADDDMRWRAATSRLLTEARAAEARARELSGEAATQDRAAASRAYAGIAAQASPAGVAWARAEQTAEAQVLIWQEIAQLAGATRNPNWQVVAGSAFATSQQWTADRDTARDQAAYWTSRYNDALASEQRMQEPAG
jgi:hypothetical protein